MDNKDKIDKRYQLELREFKEKFLRVCNKKEKKNIAERIREEKAERLRNIIKNKEIETAKDNLEKLIKEKESIEIQGIKPAPERSFTMGTVVCATATFTNSIVTTSSSTQKDKK
jgi:hypothetical protein